MHQHLLLYTPFVDDSDAMIALQGVGIYEVKALIHAELFVKNKFNGRYSMTEFYQADAFNYYSMTQKQILEKWHKR